MSIESLPDTAYIPGGPYPRPIESDHTPEVIREENWSECPNYLRGYALFNNGYYWEAHEVWEGLWHAAGRVGPIADLLRGLIKLAAAGVKVRQNQRHGIVTHATRAALMFQSAESASGCMTLLGMRLAHLFEIATSIAKSPPSTVWDLSVPLVRVFEFSILPIDKEAWLVSEDLPGSKPGS